MSPKDDVLEVEGVVDESLPNATFRVHLDSGQAILAHLSGKMRMNYIKILPGDRVIVEMSVYDLTKGRITRRLPVKSAAQMAADALVEEKTLGKPEDMEQSEVALDENKLPDPEPSTENS